jgi:DNA polymerase III epsilon subunit-like protein
MTLSLIFDTETTGLIRCTAIPVIRQPRVIEFCGLLIEDDGTIIESLEFRCNPGIPIPNGASHINGIYDADVKGLPSFYERIEEVLSIFERADSIVAHNLNYDATIIKFELERSKDKLGLEAYQNCISGMFNGKNIICTVENTLHMCGYRLSLTKLHELLFQAAFPESHRARGDVEALVKCYVELKRRGEL